MYCVYLYRAYQDKKDLIDRSLYALMHYAFYKENRVIIAENGGIPFLKQLISQYIEDKSLVKEAINLAWNLGCDLGKSKIYCNKFIFQYNVFRIRRVLAAIRHVSDSYSGYLIHA
jgi:hypothetical protein